MSYIEEIVWFDVKIGLYEACLCYGTNCVKEGKRLMSKWNKEKLKVEKDNREL